jgi:hypothetical protein
MQVALQVALVSILISSHICGCACRRHSDKLQQDPSAGLSPLVDDLNRTSAHQVQPARSPPVRPHELASLGQSSSVASKRVAAPPDSTHQERHNHSGPARPGQPARPAANQQVGPAVSSLASVRTKWRQMELTIGKSVAAAGSELKRTLDDVYRVLGQTDHHISQSCGRALDELVEGLKDEQLWAVQMLDSSAALRGPPGGLLEGTFTDLGHFDECLAVGQRPADPTAGQYCSVLIKPALVGRPRLHTVCRRMPSLSPMLSSAAAANTTLKLLSQQSHQFYYAGLRLGICLPSGCSQPDVERILQAYLIRFELIGQVKHCQQAADDSGGGRAETPSSERNATRRTIGAKSSSLVQSISQQLDLQQQYIV